MEAFAEGRGDAADVREAIAPMMPQPGEDTSSVSDVFANVYSHCTELAAGRAAERVLLGDDDTRSAADDRRQARELALLFCKSEEAIETFIAHCDVAARDLLMPYGDVVMVLSTVLRIRRTLDGAEIDKIIRDVEARKALAHRRRAIWDCTIKNAAAFKPEQERYQKPLSYSCLKLLTCCEKSRGNDHAIHSCFQHEQRERRFGNRCHDSS